MWTAAVPENQEPVLRQDDKQFLNIDQLIRKLCAIDCWGKSISLGTQLNNFSLDTVSLT